MRARIQQWLYRIQGSYWFVPALMAIAAIILSQVTVHLDRNTGAGWMSDMWWASLNQPDGARSLLATVAGSMITVTGVTFSLTILAVSYATSHFGPRLLDNFMRDRGNQVTLGTFVATFLYCLLVLRTVRSGNDSADAALQTATFVPHISVMVAIVLTLASVGVLIYFIHHIPESIHISNVLDRIATQLSEMIDELYPEALGQPLMDHPQDVGELMAGASSIVAGRSGYLQGIDETALLDFTGEQDAVLELLVRPGDYLLAGQQIARIKHAASEPADLKTCTTHCHGSMAIGITRTPTQDMRVLVNQFVEIAARALSPGVNDPFTAIQCIDQLGKAMVELASRSLPTRFRKDDDGQLRIITTKSTWEDIIDHAFGRLVPYVGPDPNVSAHLKETIQLVCTISNNLEINRLLCEISDRLDKSVGSGQP